MATSPTLSSPITPAREPGSSVGMTWVNPAKDRPLRDEETHALQGTADTGQALPHERDQSIDMTDATTDVQVKQASRDLRRGLQDTDKGKPMNEPTGSSSAEAGGRCGREFATYLIAVRTRPQRAKRQFDH